MAQRLKPAMQETQVRSLDWADALEKEMATHSSNLAWRIPWGRNLVGYSLQGRKESDTTEQLHFHFFIRGLGLGSFSRADRGIGGDRKSTRLNSSHSGQSRMPSSA